MNKLWKFAVFLGLSTVLLFGQASVNRQSKATYVGTVNVGFNQYKSGQTATLQDGASQSQTWEVAISGTAPGSITVTGTGCMRGGTCAGSASFTTTSITSSTGVSSGLWDNYAVVATWTGGDTTTVITVNLTATVARAPLSGSLPIVVANNIVSCPTCGASSGNVTGVSLTNNIPIVGNGASVIVTDSTHIVARTGADISTSDTVTSTHLSSPLPIAQGGLNSTATVAPGQVAVGNAGGTAYAPVTFSKDATLTSAGLVTITGVGGTAFSTALTGQLFTGLNAGVPSFGSPGLAGRTVAGTTDAILGDSATALRDRGTAIEYTSASPVSVTIAQAGTSGFLSNFMFGFSTRSTLTITPTTSTITKYDGYGALVGQSSITVPGGSTCTVYSSDNTNYVARCVAAPFDAFGGVYVDNVKFPNLCGALAYAATNATRRSRVYDFSQYEAWTKDPINDATCGNYSSTQLSASIYLGNGVFINGTGGSIVLQNSVELYLQGRASEQQVKSGTGCGSAAPTFCNGTLLIGYTASAPFTGTFALTCPGCTLFPVSTPMITWGPSGASFGSVLRGPGTISCGGVAGSIGIQNNSGQEQSFAEHIGIVGCLGIGLDWEQAGAQNSYFNDIEVLNGILTGCDGSGGCGGVVGPGIPPTFVCFKISINAPNRTYGNSTCNPRGNATTAPINVAVLILNTRGGVYQSFHLENFVNAFVMDNVNNATFIGNNTAGANQDSSTPDTFYTFCGPASPSPCSGGGGTTKQNQVIGASRIAPNVTTNMIKDLQNSRTIVTVNGGTGEYAQDPPQYGNPLALPDGGTGSQGGLNIGLRDSFCNGAVGTANALPYELVPNSTGGINCSSTQSATTFMPMGNACTAGHMFATASVAGAVAGSGVVILNKSGAGATAVTCTLGTGLSCSDVAHTVAYAATDKWGVTVTTGQATDTTANVRVTFSCQ